MKNSYDFFAPPPPDNSFNPIALNEQFELVNSSWKDLVIDWYEYGPGKDLQHKLLAKETDVKYRLKKRYYVFPEHPLRALYKLSREEINVIIIGDEPSNLGNVSDGLAFSSNLPQQYNRDGWAIGNELNNDIGAIDYGISNLCHWEASGVLLLNLVLTVENENPRSHRDIGWEVLTDGIIENLANSAEPKVFMLWGNRSKNKMEKIKSINEEHLVIATNAPNSTSQDCIFKNSKPFSKANEFLLKYNKKVAWLRSNPAVTLKDAQDETVAWRWRDRFTNQNRLS
jgi:uracil-DNA glycosylase